MINLDMCGLSADAITDSYKAGNSRTYAINAFDHVVKIANSYSNFTPRKNAYMEFCDQSDDTIVPYGMLHVFRFVTSIWDNTFFKVDREHAIKRFSRRLKNHFGSLSDHEQLISDMSDLHELGYLPIEVRSIDEGTRYPLGLPIFTVKATIDEFAWLVNYLETITSNLVWPMINTATKIEQFYLQARHYGELSAPKELVDIWLPVCVHEFGLRGYWGPEAGIRASSASSLFFKGSDSIGVLDFFESEYGTDPDEVTSVISVRASEHADTSRMLSLFRHLAKESNGSLMNFFGRQVDPADVLLNTERYVLEWFIRDSKGIMSYVADTENYYRLLNTYAAELKDLIEAREDREDGQPAIFTFRPDSSRRTPLTVICGYKYAGDADIGRSGTPDRQPIGPGEYITMGGKFFLYERSLGWVEISEDEANGSLVSLWNIFGGVEKDTDAGMMKFINPKVGLIYGEAISQSHQKEIYERMIEMGFSVVNIIMGKGSYATLENNTRDLFSMSYKQTFSEAILMDTEGKVSRVNLAQQKTPMGDVSKTSARGLLKVSYGSDGFILEQDVTEAEEKQGCLTLLLKDGKFFKEQTLNDIKSAYSNNPYSQG